MNASYKILTPLFLLGFIFAACERHSASVRQRENFGAGWMFHLGDVDNAEQVEFDDASWRALSVPHDWSIEGEFSADHPATPGGGALPGGIGWYRKSFTLPESDKDKLTFIDFDGVYMNSDVWINGFFLGHRPYGYISFRYELTPFLNYGEKPNILAVRVDNSLQPNSRWYSGCGIYRHVWLVRTNPVYIDQWGTFVTTPQVEKDSAIVHVRTFVKNAGDADKVVTLKSIIYDETDKKIAEMSSDQSIGANESGEFVHDIDVQNPDLWSVTSPKLYTLHSRVFVDGSVVDDDNTSFGIRTFHFDVEKGFSLNGQPMKILGVCMHHDLGCLGSAINVRALERQLEMLKAMGCNGIRTSHNPPAPELLALCDRMGFIVMDEAFDMWKKKKTTYDYSLYYDEWHKRDLTDFIKRDRNHPCVMIWSIGNEILEQWDESGLAMAQELADFVRALDDTRPITSGLNYPQPENFIVRSGALDLIGFNYHHEKFVEFPETFPGKKFIGAETGSALATRGAYDMPSDSLRIWPKDWRKPEKYNEDYTCSSYDNCRVGWGSTHEATWKLIANYEYLGGMFYWTGFDYLGEPTPYWWPARSSYFGIIDLAGFPKDAYYFYQAEWTDQPVLHLFPHWNWQEGDTVDVWVYSNFDKVELFLNDQSLGVKEKSADAPTIWWRVDYEPGDIRAVGMKKNGDTLTKKVRTAGEPAALRLAADRHVIAADGVDLSFVTVTVLDADGNIVPKADNLIQFEISGTGFIAGVDNGNPVSHEPFKANYRRTFNGLCLAVIQSSGEKGDISLSAVSEGLAAASINIEAE
ncbi:DUF4982 domain-containing protein [candidate division KSB1 bacterium]|nr:DUF4982 domain-containing protein [candidate division KSB1 bacterium]RQW05546.1 MAG: DUF4982 domain-containing protein [candidate division KSB1 bacterium]